MPTPPFLSSIDDAVLSTIIRAVDAEIANAGDAKSVVVDLGQFQAYLGEWYGKELLAYYESKNWQHVGYWREEGTDRHVICKLVLDDHNPTV